MTRHRRGRKRGRRNYQRKKNSLLKSVLIVFLVFSALVYFFLFDGDLSILSEITVGISFLGGFIAVCFYLVFKATFKRISHMC
jgi:Ca2+/Na+ antiporter